MPKETFTNLSEEKKDRVIQAAMSVFTEKSFNESSVTEIVSRSGISRGSFYQYFEDKLDLYLYLIGLFKRNYHNLMIQTFQKHSGNFYEAYKDYSCYYIENISTSSKFGFFENLYLNMNYQLSQESINIMFTDERKNRLYDVVDLDDVTISSKEELVEVLRFLHDLLNNCIMEGFWTGAPVSDTQANFIKRLDWVFYGISTKKKGDEH